MGHAKGEQVPTMSKDKLRPTGDTSIQAPTPALQQLSDPYHKQDYGSRFPGLESTSKLNVPKTRDSIAESATGSTTSFQFPKLRRALTFGSHLQPSNQDGHRRTISVDQIQSHVKLRAMNRVASQADSVHVKSGPSTLTPVKAPVRFPSGTHLRSEKWAGATIEAIQSTGIHGNSPSYVAIDIINKAPAPNSQHDSQPLDVAAVLDTSYISPVVPCSNSADPITESIRRLLLRSEVMKSFDPLRPASTPTKIVLQSSEPTTRTANHWKITCC